MSERTTSSSNNVSENNETEPSISCTVTETGSHRYRLYHRAVLQQAADKIWSEIRDARKLAAIVVPVSRDTFVWLDGGGPERVPSRFRCAFENSTLLEEVEFRDDAGYVLRYRLVEPLLGIEEFVASAKLTSLDGTKTVIELTRDMKLQESVSVEELRQSLEKELGLLQAHFRP